MVEEATLTADLPVSESVSKTSVTANELREPLPEQRKPKKELPRQSSLGALMKDIHQEVVTGKEENKLELNEETVVPVWLDFLKDNRDKLQNAFLSVADKQAPALIHDFVTFTESNNISLELLQLHKSDILAYYRKRTTSTAVMLDFKLKRNEVQKSYKTPKDRLKDMILDNPAVLKLIEKLDLNEY